MISKIFTTLTLIALTIILTTMIVKSENTGAMSFIAIISVLWTIALIATFHAITATKKDTSISSNTPRRKSFSQAINQLNKEQNIF